MGMIRGNSLLSSMAHSLSFSARSQSHAYTSSSDSHNLALNKFEAGLADKLCSLKSGTASANLNWLIDALAVANSTQSSLRSILPQLASQHNQKLQQSLDLTVVLLDVCSALKDAMAEIQDYLLALQRAVKHVLEATSNQKARSMQVAATRLQRCLARIDNGNKRQWQLRLEDASSSLKLFKKKMQKSNSVLHCSVLEGATLTTALVLAAAAAAMASSSCRVAKCSANAPWASPLRELQRQLAHEDGTTVFLQELESLHVAVSAVQRYSSNSQQNDEISSGVTKLASEAVLKKVRHMEASVAELRVKLDSLFQSLLASVRLDSLVH